MKIKQRLTQLSVSLIIQLSLLAACSFGVPVTKNQKSKFPVLFDPRYSFQIYAVESGGPFPFSIGDVVEIKGLLIYHGVPEWVRSEILAEAEWNASLYPFGTIASDEEIVLRLRGISKKIEYELIWAVDKDANLQIVSDLPAPPELFTDPRPGDVREVCVTMTIDELHQEENDSERFLRIVLKPIGEKKEMLIKSTIRECEE
jgi:hypothetical protein